MASALARRNAGSPMENMRGDANTAASPNAVIGAESYTVVLS